MLFECLAGAPPFAGRSVLRVGMAHLEEEPGDPGASRDDVPPALSWTVRQALAKDPGRRPTSAVALARMLCLAAAEGPAVAATTEEVGCTGSVSRTAPWPGAGSA